MIKFLPALLLAACLLVALLPAQSTVALSRLRPPRPAAPQQDEDVVKVTTDLVVINATVIGRDGKFVPGLKRDDFHVFEDGQEQRLSSFTAEETPFAAAILLDVSGSMETRLTLSRSAALRFLEKLRDEDVASVYSFYTRVEQWEDFSPGHDLPDKVFSLHAKTLTALNDAVFRAADDLAKRPEKRRAIVVLSDGGENSSHVTADKALDHALQASATIYAVNMSEEGPTRDFVGVSALRNFAEKSGGRYISTPGGEQLRDALSGIAEELSHQYTLTYRPINRERNGKWRAINLKLARADADVRTRKGYRAPKG